MARRKLTTEEFIARSNEKHNFKYTYSKAVYQGSFIGITITCPVHGDFTQQPSNHLKGSGCRQCTFDMLNDLNQKSTEDFITTSKLIHGDRYSYKNTEYKSAHSNVGIICTVHGYFEQRASNHLNGSGCPKCAKNGYQVTKPGYLYMMVCGNITKVGITNLNPKTRCKDISRSFGEDFTILKTWYFGDGEVPDAIETLLLKELRSAYKQPERKFDGSTECFISVDREALMIRIGELTPITEEST